MDFSNEGIDSRSARGNKHQQNTAGSGKSNANKKGGRTLKGMDWWSQVEVPMLNDSSASLVQELNHHATSSINHDVSTHRQSWANNLQSPSSQVQTQEGPGGHQGSHPLSQYLDYCHGNWYFKTPEKSQLPLNLNESDYMQTPSPAFSVHPASAQNEQTSLQHTSNLLELCPYSNVQESGCRNSASNTSSTFYPQPLPSPGAPPQGTKSGSHLYPSQLQMLADVTVSEQTVNSPRFSILSHPMLTLHYPVQQAHLIGGHTTNYGNSHSGTHLTGSLSGATQYGLHASGQFIQDW